MSSVRAKLEEALAKPLPESDGMVHSEVFSPWDDVIIGILGGYSKDSDDLMIAALEAVRDGTTFDLIKSQGFVAEFALYVLAGHRLTDYGGSPRGAWADFGIKDLWQPLIDKWRAYSNIVWNAREAVK